MTIGERLTEARTRKGISIREAAEATKIRGEYLSAMEENSFSYNLPEIYKRGFLRNYAKFLKLDPEKLMTDYNAQLIGRQQSVTSNRETYGRIELPADNKGPASGSDSSRSSHSKIPDKPSQPAQRMSARNVDEADEDPEGYSIWTDNALLTKIAIGIGGASLLALLLVVLISLLRSGDDSAISQPSTVAAPSPTQTVPAVPASVEFIVRASASVTLIIDSVASGERLFSGTLNANESTPTLTKTGAISIRFTSGDAIVIEQNGQQIRPNQSGVGRMVVP